jgi:NADH:ubiquinone oxidoreductase subunit 4 (subunit M)
MGMWPFGQVWLPDAHPAAPSPVSALLSGVMIKTGVYGLIRYFLWLVPPEVSDRFPLGGWGAAVAVLGTLTLLTGTAQALQQERSKRLLATPASARSATSCSARARPWPCSPRATPGSGRWRRWRSSARSSTW